MAVATVTIRPSITPGVVTGKYVCDSSPSLTSISVGFVPSVVEVWNITDKDVYTLWSQDMTDGHAMTITTAAASITSGAITPIAHTDGSNLGFSVGTDSSVQEASKTWGFRATR